ncbi:hypothetical protein CCUS01_11702 [Colletotrichum cuscutae]|uniref:Uncharacterized protein n=1 Tax=Colletotrichum cuscutae TaxID=1209917 RepID=A0AAI9XG68_9PEZI|nr:hypothetical protein CCUS01_11702 [Colletotrichum cuscutae]
MKCISLDRQSFHVVSFSLRLSKILDGFHPPMRYGPTGIGVPVSKRCQILLTTVNPESSARFTLRSLHTNMRACLACSESDIEPTTLRKGARGQRPDESVENELTSCKVANRTQRDPDPEPLLPYCRLPCDILVFRLDRRGRDRVVRILLLGRKSRQTFGLQFDSLVLGLVLPVQLSAEGRISRSDHEDPLPHATHPGAQNIYFVPTSPTKRRSHRQRWFLPLLYPKAEMTIRWTDVASISIKGQHEAVAIQHPETSSITACPPLINDLHGIHQAIWRNDSKIETHSSAGSLYGRQEKETTHLPKPQISYRTQSSLVSTIPVCLFDGGDTNSVSKPRSCITLLMYTAFDTYSATVTSSRMVSSLLEAFSMALSRLSCTSAALSACLSRNPALLAAHAGGLRDDIGYIKNSPANRRNETSGQSRVVAHSKRAKTQEDPVLSAASPLSIRARMLDLYHHRRATDGFFTSELQATLPTSGFNCQRVESISTLQHWKSRNSQWTHQTTDIRQSEMPTITPMKREPMAVVDAMLGNNPTFELVHDDTPRLSISTLSTYWSQSNQSAGVVYTTPKIPPSCLNPQRLVKETTICYVREIRGFASPILADAQIMTSPKATGPCATSATVLHRDGCISPACRSRLFGVLYWLLANQSAYDGTSEHLMDLVRYAVVCYETVANMMHSACLRKKFNNIPSDDIWVGANTRVKQLQLFFPASYHASTSLLAVDLGPWTCRSSLLVCDRRQKIDSACEIFG